MQCDPALLVWLSSSILLLAAAGSSSGSARRRKRARDLGIEVGELTPGAANAITDVPGVRVGHKTVVSGAAIRTGVTAVLPHDGNLYQEKVPAAVCVGNGFGKLAGYTQVEELGNIETPILLTNTMSVGTVVTAVVNYTLSRPGNEEIRSVNAVVGETNDVYLNDIRSARVTERDVVDAIEAAQPGPVGEGSIGAGTGTTAFGFKSGIGTASRLVPAAEGRRYVLGVLAQTNFGGRLEINGVPVGRELGRPGLSGDAEKGIDGSCMLVVATDAPLCSRNLKRIARRAFCGLARTGSYLGNGSGDYAVCFSTAYRIPNNTRQPYALPPLLPNDAMTPFFQAVIEATEESVYNSLFAATAVKGFKGRVSEPLPVDEVVRICRKYRRLGSPDGSSE